MGLRKLEGEVIPEDDEEWYLISRPYELRFKRALELAGVNEECADTMYKANIEGATPLTLGFPYLDAEELLEARDVNGEEESFEDLVKSMNMMQLEIHQDSPTVHGRGRIEVVFNLSKSFSNFDEAYTFYNKLKKASE